MIFKITNNFSQNLPLLNSLVALKIGSVAFFKALLNVIRRWGQMLFYHTAVNFKSDRKVNLHTSLINVKALMIIIGVIEYDGTESGISTDRHLLILFVAVFQYPSPTLFLLLQYLPQETETAIHLLTYFSSCSACKLKCRFRLHGWITCLRSRLLFCVASHFPYFSPIKLIVIWINFIHRVGCKFLSSLSRQINSIQVPILCEAFNLFSLYEYSCSNAFIPSCGKS